MKADSYAYRDRRNRKRDFRRLWITRINAAARLNGMSYWHLHARHEARRARARPQGPRPTSPSATPRPSADSPRPPARRRRALPSSPADIHSSPGRRFLSQDRRPSRSWTPSMITCHHNQLLKDIRRLQRRPRGEAPFVAEGEDLVAGGGAAGLGAASCASRPAWTSRPTPWRGSARLASARACSASTRSAGPRRRAARSASRCGGGGPGNVGTVVRRRARLRRRERRARPGLRRPLRTQGGARVDGRRLRCPDRAHRGGRRAAGPVIALAAQGSACRAGPRARCSSGRSARACRRTPWPPATPWPTSRSRQSR